MLCRSGAGVNPGWWRRGDHRVGGSHQTMDPDRPWSSGQNRGGEYARLGPKSRSTRRRYHRSRRVWRGQFAGTDEWRSSGEFEPIGGPGDKRTVRLRARRLLRLAVTGIQRFRARDTWPRRFARTLPRGVGRSDPAVSQDDLRRGRGHAAVWAGLPPVVAGRPPHSFQQRCQR